MPESYGKMSPRKNMGTSGKGGKAGYSGLPKKMYSDRMDGDGAPAPKRDVAEYYPLSKKLGKVSSGPGGDEDY